MEVAICHLPSGLADGHEIIENKDIKKYEQHGRSVSRSKEL